MQSQKTFVELEEILQSPGQAAAESTFKIAGMFCPSCVLSIENHVSKTLPGINNISVNLLSERAVVQYDPSYTNNDAIKV